MQERALPRNRPTPRHAWPWPTRTTSWAIWPNGPRSSTSPQMVSTSPRPAREAGRRPAGRSTVSAASWPIPTTTSRQSTAGSAGSPQAKQEYAAANSERQKLAAETIPIKPDAARFRRDLAEGRYNFGVMLFDCGGVSRGSRCASSSDRRIRAGRATSSPRASTVAANWRSPGGWPAMPRRNWRNPPPPSPITRHARQIAEPLARGNPLLTQLQADVAAIYMSIGESSSSRSIRPPRSVASSGPAASSNNLPATIRPSHDIRADLANCLGSIALISGRTADWPTPGKLSKRPASVQEQLVKESPGNLDDQAALGRTLDELSVLLWQADRKDEALAMSRRATGLLQAAYEKSPGAAGIRNALSNHDTNLAIFERNPASRSRRPRSSNSAANSGRATRPNCIARPANWPRSPCPPAATNRPNRRPAHGSIGMRSLSKRSALCRKRSQPDSIVSTS